MSHVNLGGNKLPTEAGVKNGGVLFQQCKLSLVGITSQLDHLGFDGSMFQEEQLPYNHSNPSFQDALQ
jgi:hypothetical protein